MQAKSDILALIWGPVKLLLVLTSTMLKPFDAIREIMYEIGSRLPFIEAYTELFATNDRILEVVSVLQRHLRLSRYSSQIVSFQT